MTAHLIVFRRDLARSRTYRTGSLGHPKGPHRTPRKTLGYQMPAEELTGLYALRARADR